MHAFDEIIPREGTNALKYDFAAERGKPPGLIPLWVADMDFRTAPAVLEALHLQTSHGIFGYSESRDGYSDVLRRWFRQRFGWKIEPEWVVKTPGVVFAICAAIRAYTEVGDAVLIQRPVYYPFSSSILDNGRELVNNPLKYAKGRYTIDFEDFEAKVRDRKVKLFLLCNPHNPVGRVWTWEELMRIGEICLRHGVTVVADEIHADFVWAGSRHLVFADLCPEFSRITVTCTSPSKTFNLAGLQISNILVRDPEMRTRLVAEIAKTGYSQVNTMGIVACEAAYGEGAVWLDGLKSYLVGNISFVREFLPARIPSIRMVEPEGTYLIWLDCSGLGLAHEALERLILEAGLWLDGGTMFGEEGEGFQRVNIACPRTTLERALSRLEAAVGSLASGSGVEAGR